MKIKFIDIQNFRKLKSCRIELEEKQTVFVGANNSGKTSAMDALRLFLKKDRRITTIDFTLINWKQINEIGKKWLELPEGENPDLFLETWRSLVPSMDIWLNVDVTELHLVSHLIPTLDWEPGLLGVRLGFEPKDIEKFYSSFVEEWRLANKVISASENAGKNKLTLWPKNLKDFLDKQLDTYFGIKAFILDPKKIGNIVDGKIEIQKLDETTIPLEIEPFKNLFKIDLIHAQRGFSDANSESSESNLSYGGLTSQSKGLFNDHLDPTKQPSVNDIDALIAIEDARQSFDVRLNASFKTVIDELKDIGYPGFTDPQIKITSKVNMTDSLNHDSAIQFNVLNTEEDDDISYLPEKYNGLGYQNLISMVLKLIRFRYEWMKDGKLEKNIEDEDSIIQPLHIVLIEEPEAHLHAQVQQVFINKAYEVLRNHLNLKDSIKFTTQMIVSTHSSHIAHELDFKSLRYFKKITFECKEKLPCSEVVNLSEVFGKDTDKFVARYLKLTHCDLFFADAAILVEGPAEKMLVPNFISNSFIILDSKYITLLEIGGSHAHRFKPLIESLGLITLIVTDIDSIDSNNEKVQPARDPNFKSGNDTLKSWLPKKSNLIELLDLIDVEKISEKKLIRVAYQYPFEIEYANTKVEVIPYTFEDALVFSNIDLFKNLTSPKGLLKKMSDALSEASATTASKSMFEALYSGKKAEMALELLFIERNIVPPKYIVEGLSWLQNKLKIEQDDLVCATNIEAES